jgi:hypothetical protein
MKKYYLVGTDEEVLMGDIISDVSFEKTFDNGITLRRKEEFEVTEDSLPYLLDMGVLEECDEEEDDLVDFDGEETCEAVEELSEDLANLTKRVEKLEELGVKQTMVLDKMFKDLKECINGVNEAIKKAEEKEAKEKKTASSKKK